MTNSQENKTGLKKNYLIAWYVSSAIIGLILRLAYPSFFQNGDVVTTHPIVVSMVIFPLSIIIWAFLGIVVEAAFNYNWQFGQVKHSPISWYIYPIFFWFLCLKIGLFMILSIFLPPWLKR